MYTQQALAEEVNIARQERTIGSSSLAQSHEGGDQSDMPVCGATTTCLTVKKLPISAPVLPRRYTFAVTPTEDAYDRNCKLI
ncbi:hypothetical protein BD311DRAFT_734352 [Dichomitus squalens]|uniref:Uncharacterized protein n=1 Tax=Dichomitus squalens TaxID=114155 RepID=A0A4Q9M3X7_9APHY|nr:hypothetical protein BD311DRAFT_734352 [Dichomitus squalens]